MCALAYIECVPFLTPCYMLQASLSHRMCALAYLECVPLLECVLVLEGVLIASLPGRD